MFASLQRPGFGAAFMEELRVGAGVPASPPSGCSSSGSSSSSPRDFTTDHDLTRYHKFDLLAARCEWTPPGDTRMLAISAEDYVVGLGASAMSDADFVRQLPEFMHAARERGFRLDYGPGEFMDMLMENE